VNRRDFIVLGGGVAVAWPLGGARAQSRRGMRRLGVLMGGSKDPSGQARAAALVQGLASSIGTMAAICVSTGPGLAATPRSTNGMR
jgi:hypothetical protein